MKDRTWLGQIANRIRGLTQTTPRVFALQVGLTTTCQSSCFYCPRTALRGSWTDGILSWDVYEKSIAPAFGYFKMIFLQGWGEPLLHPRFWDMAALAKRSGSQVGFRTNALLYDEAAIERTLDMELDFISFTLTGASAATHQHHRSGTDFDLICRRVRQLRERRSARNKSLYISLNYTLMRSNLQELPAAVELAATLGADQICVEHMDCIPILPMEKQVVFLNPQETDPDVVAEVQRIAEQRSILFSCEPMTVSPDSRTCSADPLRGTLYVTTDARIVPCHQMALPPGAVANFWFHGKPSVGEPVVLGRADQQSLLEILRSENTRQLLQALTKSEPEYPLLCRNCYKLYGV